MATIVTRFAPSPTGHLHIGGARTAIFCWLLARHFGGKFYLRIEDTDTERSRQEYTDSILASMGWLGLDWDGELAYQTQRTDLYNAYVDKLLANGQAYWCSCTPDEVDAMREAARAQGLKPRYDGRCRNRDVGPGQGHCVRLKAPLSGKVVFDDLVKGTIAVDAAELDDMILRRSDGMPTYNMAVVVDDYEMGVTHVIRGDDHVSNTPKQILIYEALGLPLPRFGHVPMILGPDKQKLSKRHGARAVIEYQQDGLLPQALVNYLVRLGWSHGDQELFGLQELIQLFDGTSLNASPSAFDADKLQWLNAQYLRATPAAELAKLTRPFAEAALAKAALDGAAHAKAALDGAALAKAALDGAAHAKAALDGAAHAESGSHEALSDARLCAAVRLYQERANSLVELGQALLPVLVSADQLPYDSAAGTKALKDNGRQHVAALREIFARLEPFEAPALEAALQAYVEQKGLKFKQVGPPLRFALSGNLGGPHLPDIMAVLGREESLARLDKVAALPL